MSNARAAMQRASFIGLASAFADTYVYVPDWLDFKAGNPVGHSVVRTDDLATWQLTVRDFDTLELRIAFRDSKLGEFALYVPPSGAPTVMWAPNAVAAPVLNTSEPQPMLEPLLFDRMWHTLRHALYRFLTDKGIALNEATEAVLKVEA